ncbi:glycosyl hydrolase family 20, catalytic domain protein [Trichuris suis]|nr:glycosyl hydrolase family 20, catalytic domain protein [Trichuris suis]
MCEGVTRVATGRSVADSNVRRYFTVMKVYRWRGKPAFAFITVLTVILLIIGYHTITSRHGDTVIHEGVFQRGAAMRKRTVYGQVDEKSSPTSTSTDLTMKTTTTYSQNLKEPPPSNVFIPKRRIVHLDLKGAAPKPQHFRAFFEYFVRIGATGILIEWEDMFPYEGRLSDLRNGDAYSADDVRMILSTADQLRLEVIPLVQTIGHLEWLLKTHKFYSFRENPRNPQSVCVSNAEAVDLVLHLVDQVMAFHKDYGQFVHIGADEVYQYGECSRCVARMNKENLRREDLLLRHIVNVSKHVKTKYGKNVLMWHDMIANIDASLAEKYDLKNLVEPVLWNYAEDLEAFLPMGIWETFSAMVPYMWGSSAFKGADSPTRYHSNVKHYLENHISWIKQMSTASEKFREFRGLIFTGWQRYDHFAVLCEFLPIGIPSLTVNMLTIRNGRFDASVNDQAISIMQCVTGSDVKGDLYGCRFPGSDIYHHVQLLHEKKGEIEKLLLQQSVQGWLSNIAIDYNMSSPWYMNLIVPDLMTYKNQMIELSLNIRQAMLEMFYENAVDEFLFTYVDPVINHLQRVLDRATAIQRRDEFPVRPFPIKRTIDTTR